MVVIQGCLSGSVKQTCTKYSCHGSFPHCDEITETCEAVGRRGSDPKVWIDYSLGATNDIFTRVSCSKDGNYPSTDCRTFYRCEGGKATLKACSSPGYPFFDSVLERCTNTKRCPTFDCFNKPNLKVGLKEDISPFYAYCLQLYHMVSPITDSLVRNTQDLLPKVITRCYGQDIFNLNTQRCEPRCLQVGVIPDTKNCHSYFLCSMVDPINSVFKMKNLHCPARQAFHEKLHDCVSEDIVPSCNKTYPSPI